MCFFRKKKAKKLALEQERLKKEQEAKAEQAKATQQKVEVASPKVEVKKEAPVEKEAPKQEQPTPKPAPVKEEAPAEVKEVKKPATKKVEPASSDDVSEDEIKGEKASKIPKYHVSQNKDEKSDNFKKWRVRKEGSTKTIKFFNTQKEAIEYAESLAESAGSTVVIHKIDGSIRKQDYAKKE
jgi:hypothetical protein